MNSKSLIVVILLVSTVLSAGLAAIVVQERKPKKVNRVKRPQFTERDWDGIYYNNLFQEGLVGNRPASLGTDASVSAPNLVANSDSPQLVAEFAWPKFIFGATLEDEAKALLSQLNQDLTTPVKFKTEYANVRQSFAILSMVFAIIREYEGDVRWKKFSRSAQVSFERGAANARVGTAQSFESCRRRKVDLQEMIRGGNFAGEEKAPETLDWSLVIDRSPLMERVQKSQDALKRLTANADEFTGDIANVFHESQMVAAMAQTLKRENMPDADDDGYLQLAESMSRAAVQISQACQTQDYESASQAVNLLGQSCSNCHDAWR